MKEYKRTIDHSWDFQGVDTKEYTHCYHNYPAMMIPQIARRLITEYKPAGAESLLDPYCGSGTSLVEGLLAGLNVCGYDLNPLALMISKTKCRSFTNAPLGKYFIDIKDRLTRYFPDAVTPDQYKKIKNWEYWFSEETFKKLHFIQRCIDLVVDDGEGRQFFYIPLAETVRETSFTRNGEFKRYRMDKEKLARFSPDVFGTFVNKVERNLKGLESYRAALPTPGAMGAAITMKVNSCEMSDNFISAFEKVPYDMVVTSPPYGDSRTTVAYGEFSSWANEWFGLSDKSLDKELMGGKKQTKELFTSESVESALVEIKKTDEKRYFEVVSFLNDYYKSICNISRIISPGGVACYVVGNRTVKNVQIPLDYFTAEIFEQNGFKHVETIVREFPTKRMPSKNSPTNKSGEKSSTITNEYIVILKKL